MAAAPARAELSGDQVVGHILAVQAAPPGQTAVGAYEKKTYSYAEWAKGHFSEVVTVSNPAKLIYLSGVNAADEDSKVEVVRNPGDFAAQCRYVWGRIKGMLAKQGATLANVDKAVTYATDPRYLSDNFKCRSEVFAGISQPAGTFVGITGLGTPGMLIEVDVTAHVPR